MIEFEPLILTSLLAYGLDRWLGDPAWPPHPVRGLGWVLDRLEPWCRRTHERTGLSLILLGGLVTLGLALGSAGLAGYLRGLPLIGWLLGLYLAWAGLALGCLLRECERAARVIASGDLPAARLAVAMLVSRDTSILDGPALRRTLAETLSENFCDGFVAPFFWLGLTGPVGLWAYKAVSTMDSMWGYKTPRYLELGRVCARTDDVLAWVPARLAALGLLIAGGRAGLTRWRSLPGLWARVRLDARRMESPNAGWTMAAAAWVIGAGMGGPALYFGQVKDKPHLGPDGEWSPERLEDLLRLVRLASWPVLIAVLAVPLTLVLLLD